MSNQNSKGVVAGRMVTALAPRGDRSVATPVSPQVSPQVSADAAVAAQVAEEEAAQGVRGDEGASAARTQRISKQDLAAAEQQLARRIRAHLSPCILSIKLTDNRYTMISVRRDRQGQQPHFKVRLHAMFAMADPSITRALARYIAHNDREASSVLGEYIEANQHSVRARGRRIPSPRLVMHGKVHNLKEIYDDLNQRYFAGGIDARITWGPRMGKPRRRNSIKMGSYSVEDRLIRIHRSLDRAFVPRFFVEWIVFHEMLHQVHEIKVVNGRRQFHTKAFLRDEAKFEHYAKARQWEQEHLDALLTC